MKIGRYACLLLLLGGSLLAQQKPVSPSLPAGLPKLGPMKRVTAPTVDERVLPNGMRVWLVRKSELPKVAFRLCLRGGYTLDPAEAPGLAQVLATAVTQGTTTRSARQIAEAAQSAGGDLSVNADADSIEMSINALSESANDVVALLADISQNASFPEADIALATTNLKSQIRARGAAPRIMAQQTLFRVLYGDHPYHVLAPTQSTLKFATVENLKALYHKDFRPDQALLIAVGSFDTPALMADIKKNFGPWNASGKAPAGVKGHAQATDHKIYLVERPKSVQSTVVLGTIGPTSHDPDEASLTVANAIYGAGFSSRLTKNIREDKGYTYHPFSGAMTRHLSGIFLTGADVRNAVTGATLKEITYELERMATTLPSTDEVENAKRYLIGNTAIDLQSHTALAAMLGSLWVQDDTPGFITSHLANVEKTTAADVQAASAKYLKPERMSVVVVGEKQAIEGDLKPFGMELVAAPAQE
jgi:predicted Zn-dependent peptidase